MRGRIVGAGGSGPDGTAGGKEIEPGARASAGGSRAPADDPAPGWRVKLLWVGLPALACALFLAVTNQICQEVAVIPFLWILPLTLYLLSFIICFYSERGYRRLFYLLALIVAVPLALAIIPRSDTLTTRLQIVVYAVALFVCCMVCHGELAASKPAPRRLTGFYLGMAIGGALGGVFVGAIAPLIFHRYWELQLGLILSWCLGVWALWRHRSSLPRWTAPLATAASVAAAIWVVVSLPSDAKLKARTVDVSRNFYGVLQVSEQHEGNADYHRRVMVHGRTIHGIQYVSEAKRRLPTSYYGAESGVGVALQLRERQVMAESGADGLKVGITGLGIGTVAAYGRPGDTYRFYEINPDVVRLAQNPESLHLSLRLPGWNRNRVRRCAPLPRAGTSLGRDSSSMSWSSMRSAAMPSPPTC